MTHPMWVSCGMPMRSQAEHARGDTGAQFCHKRATESGELKSYEEVWEGFTAFFMGTQGFDREAAGQLATRTLSNLPAWKADK